MSLEVKTFKNGDVIINEGDIGKSMYRIVEGTADVIADYGKKEPFRLAVLGEGDYIGEMAVFEDYPRSATVVARDGVKALEIPKDKLNEFFSEDPNVILELIDHLANKIRTMTNDYNEAKALLSELQSTDSGKKQSLFSKIKRHIDTYQSNKTAITEPNADVIRELYSGIAGKRSDNIKMCKSGAIVFDEADVCNCLYLLHEGKVGIYCGNEQKTSELTAVAVFGAYGLIDEEKRNAVAVSESNDTIVEIINKDQIPAIFESSPAKITVILNLLSYRVRRLNIDFLCICKEITENYNS